MGGPLENFNLNRNFQSRSQSRNVLIFGAQVWALWVLDPPDLFADCVAGFFPYYGAQNDNTHMCIVWELMSQLHRTLVAQDFLAGFPSVIGRLHKVLCTTFCERATYTHELSGNEFSNCTHICYTKEWFAN